MKDIKQRVNDIRGMSDPYMKLLKIGNVISELEIMNDDTEKEIEELNQTLQSIYQQIERTKLKNIVFYNQKSR